jgi:hypothetical protein
METRLIALLTALLLGAPLAQAGGSVDSETILAILKKGQPELWAYLSSTLEFAPAGSGIRLGAHFGELHGSRIGPYYIKARPKGATDYTLMLVVETDGHWVDKAGNPLPKAKPGQSVEEHLQGADHLEEKGVNVTITDLADYEKRGMGGAR